MIVLLYFFQKPYWQELNWVLEYKSCLNRLATNLKRFQNFKKVIDKISQRWYYKWAVSEGAANTRSEKTSKKVLTSYSRFARI